MRKIIFAAVLATASLASAGKYGTAGCGLGALAFGEQKGMIQIVAATLNGLYGNQTFAITSGTSNCTEDGVALSERERELFAESNFNVLKEEASMGAGDNIAVLASLYGCSGRSVDDFSDALQRNYGAIGSASTPSEMLQAIDDVTTCGSN